MYALHFSERYVVNSPLLRSQFRLSVCLSVCPFVPRVTRELSAISRGLSQIHRLTGHRSGSVAKKTAIKYSQPFGQCFIEIGLWFNFSLN